MTFAHLAHSPRLLALAWPIDRLPASAWLALHAAALWPTWRWLAARMADGSDDPLDLLALAALGALLLALRGQLRRAPRPGWLLAAVAGTLGATALHGVWTPLLTSLLAVLGWTCGLLAFLPDQRIGAMRVQDGVLWPGARTGLAAAPLLGLGLLALPLLASLQFYAGYPLRVLTAEASRWLLQPWFQVLRSGASLQVDGVLVIVDAPCSGVQMAWAGYFTACVVALWAGRSSRTFALRLPIVGAAVLLGNVTRNAVLVALEASGRSTPWLHQGVGLLALAGVCSAIAWGMAARRRAPLTGRS